MSRYRQCRLLSGTDAAYVAGLIDGEGTITLARRHARDQRQVVVSIANTERCLLEFVAQATGTGKITRKRVRSQVHTPSFCYSISNRQALDLLAQIVGFLRSYKRDRAGLLLSEYVQRTPRNGKYNERSRSARLEFEERFLSIKPARVVR